MGEKRVLALRETAYPYAAVLLVLFGAACWLYWPFKVDDAYTSFVYAKNLVEGIGLTYNGMVVEGYSNFLWTLLISPFLAIGIDPLTSARTLSLLFASICLIVTFNLVVEMIPRIGMVSAVLAVLSIAITAPFLAWTVGGLETAMLACLISIFVYLEISGRRELSPLVVLAASLTRPEGVLLFPIMILYRKIHTEDSIRKLFRASALFIVPFLGFLIWRWATYGYVVPNTAFVRVEVSLATIEIAARWLLDYLALRPIFAIVLAAGIALTIRDRTLLNRKWWMITVTVLVFVGAILYMGSDWMPHHRFLMPIVPLLSTYIANALVGFKSWRINLIANLAIAFTIAFEVAMAITLYRPVTIEFGRYTEGLVEAGNWIRQNTDPMDTIAVVDAGALAYYSERRTIDISGLNNGHIAHSPSNRDPDYVLALQPAVIQLQVAINDEGVLFAPRPESVNSDIIAHPDFVECYRLSGERQNDAFFPYLFLRDCE